MPAMGGYTSPRAGFDSLHNRMLWCLVTIAVVVPLPFGSVRAFFSAAAAILIAATLIYYVVGLIKLGRKPVVNLAIVKYAAIGYVITCVYLLIQILPIFNSFGPLEIDASLDRLAKWETVSIATDATKIMLLTQLSYGVFAYLVIQVCVDAKRRAVFTTAILISVVFYGALAMFNLRSGDTLLGIKKWAYIGSATGPFINRNSFATFLAFGSIIALARLLKFSISRVSRHKDDGVSRGNTTGQLLYALAYVFLIVVLIFTQSRMGFFSAMVGSVLVVALALGRLGRRPWVALGMAVVGLSAIVILLSMYGGDLFNRIDGTEEALSVRLDLYRQVWQLIWKRPLLGFGGGAFEYAFPLVHRLPVSYDFIWDRAHNTYLSLWSELGFVVGSCPVISLGILVWVSIKALLFRRQGWTAQVIAAGTAVLAAAHSLSDFSLEIPANAIVLIGLVGCGVAASIEQSSA